MDFPPLIVVTGPTATGKTSLAIELALRFGGEIINADSMQVFRFMDIGTAKPSPEQRAQIAAAQRSAGPAPSGEAAAKAEASGRPMHSTRQQPLLQKIVREAGGGGAVTADAVAAIADTPLWIFHGAKDGTVPPEGSVQAFEALVNTAACVRVFSVAFLTSAVPAGGSGREGRQSDDVPAVGCRGGARARQLDGDVRESRAVQVVPGA